MVAIANLHVAQSSSSGPGASTSLAEMPWLFENCNCYSSKNLVFGGSDHVKGNYHNNLGNEVISTDEDNGPIDGGNETINHKN